MPVDLQQKLDLLERCLRASPFDGWNDAMYLCAVKDAGLSPPQAQLMFPHGVRDVLDFFAKEMDRNMIEAASSLDLTSMKIHHRIIALLKLRFGAMLPYREAARRAQAYYLLHPAAGFKIVSRAVDEIWHLAGDRSTDFNWYSKRFLLAQVLMSTTLIWLDDQSEGQADSWAFMGRRIQDVLKITKMRKKIEEGFKNFSYFPIPLKG